MKVAHQRLQSIQNISNHATQKTPIMHQYVIMRATLEMMLFTRRLRIKYREGKNLSFKKLIQSESILGDDYFNLDRYLRFISIYFGYINVKLRRK